MVRPDTADFQELMAPPVYRAIVGPVSLATVAHRGIVAFQDIAARLVFLASLDTVVNLVLTDYLVYLATVALEYLVGLDLLDFLATAGTLALLHTHQQVL